MLASEMVTAIRSQGGFDTTSSQTTDAVLLSWVNAKYAEMVADAKWSRAVLELGPTVAGTSQYLIPDRVTDIRTLRVGGSRPWSLANLEGLWDLQAAVSTLDSGVPGVFVANWQADGDAVVELSPTPTTDGLAIEAQCSVLPDDLTTVPDTTPKVPADVHQAIVDGAIGLGLGRVYERHDAAVPYEQNFQDAIQKLMRRSKSRVGSGPMQFPVG